MNDEDKFSGPEKFWLTVVIILIAFCLGGLGYSIGIGAERKKAAEAGVGRYQADPKTGEVDFIYTK